MTTKGKILIADDEENLRLVLKDSFEKQGYKVSESSTIEDTIQLIKTEKFDVVISDTCDKGISGIIRVLEFIEKESPTTQAIIFSASAYKYEPQLKNFKCVGGYITKPALLEDIEKSVQQSILQRKEHLNTKRELLPITIKIDNKELIITDPFDLPASVFVGSLEFKTYDKLYKMLEDRYGKQIDQRFKETGARSLVLYKDDNGNVAVAGKSNSPYYPSDSELEEMQHKIGRVCYVTGRYSIEETCCSESEWTFIPYPEYQDNPYPTIPIYLGRLDEECKNIIKKKDRLIVSDFDTGNPDILAFDVKYRRILNIPYGRMQRKRINFISGEGGDFDCYVDRIQIGLYDSKKNNRFCCAEFDVWFVLNWQGTRVTTNQSPLRVAFVGRALWLPGKLRFSIILNAKDKKIRFSQVEL